MKNDKLFSVLDKAGMVILLLFALLLRSNLSYRSAFIDEAMNIFYGQETLLGHNLYIQDFHMGFAALTQVPMALADRVGGLELARGLSVILGLLTVLFVMLTARKVYGKIAGFIAGGIVAAYAPAIFTSTFAHYDAWSACFVSLAIYLWVVALSDDKDYLLALGSLAMVLAMLAKYTAVVAAAPAIGYGIVLAIFAVVTRGKQSDGDTSPLSNQAIVRKLLFGLLPFLLVLVYVLFLRESLVRAWRTTIITRHAADPITTRIEIFGDFARYLWLPFLVGLPALFWKRKRAFSIGFLILGVSAMLYHLANNDTWQIHKHSNYMAIGLASLASGGITMIMEGLFAQRLSKAATMLASGLIGLAIVVYLVLFGRDEILELRAYWPDTAEMMAYLREDINDGDLILMEAGDVGRYYLMTRGTPGHIPQWIVDTWYYKDDQGEGIDAYQRGIEGKRFAYIVFTNRNTAEFNQKLLEFMRGHYVLGRSFTASVEYRYPKPVQLDVYRPVQ